MLVEDWFWFLSSSWKTIDTSQNFRAILLPYIFLVCKWAWMRQCLCAEAQHVKLYSKKHGRVIQLHQPAWLTLLIKKHTMGKGTWYLPITLEILSMPGVLNLWVVALLGVEWSFRRHHLSPSENTDVRITIHNSSRLQLKSRNKNNFMVREVVTTRWGTELQGCSISKVDECSWMSVPSMCWRMRHL